MGKLNKTDIVMKQIKEYIKTCYKELHLEVPYDIMYGQLDILLKQNKRLNSTFKSRKQIIILHILACNVNIEKFSDWGSLLNKFKSILKELNLNVYNNITLDSLPDVVINELTNRWYELYQQVKKYDELLSDYNKLKLYMKNKDLFQKFKDSIEEELKIIENEEVINKSIYVYNCLLEREVEKFWNDETPPMSDFDRICKPIKM